MANNIIDFDPQKRLTKEALERIKETISGFTPETTDNFLILYKDKMSGVVLEAFGVDWALMGVAQAYLEALRQDLLYGPVEEDD